MFPFSNPILIPPNSTLTLTPILFLSKTPNLHPFPLSSTLANSDNATNISYTGKTHQPMKTRGSHFPTSLPPLMNSSNVFIVVTLEPHVLISSLFLEHCLLTLLFLTYSPLKSPLLTHLHLHQPFQQPPIAPHRHVLHHFLTSPKPMYRPFRSPPVPVVSYVLHPDSIPTFQADEDPR